jgi:hypothetical protein
MIKEYKESELLARLPAGWHEVSLKVAIEKLNRVNSIDVPDELKGEEIDNLIANIENGLRISSVLLDLPIKAVRNFPLSTIKKMNTKLSFLNSTPTPLKKSKYKWTTKIDEPTYDTLIFFIKASEKIEKGDFSFMPTVIKKICKDELNDDEILLMSMDEVQTGFFLLRMSLIKYLNYSALPLQVKLIKMMLLKKMKSAIQLKKKSKK